jgi:hypothetical protein
MGQLTRNSRALIASLSEDPDWYQGILDELACAEDGKPKGIWKICKERGIIYRAMLEWIRADEDRNAAFLRAQEIGAQRLADECLELADTFETPENDGSAFKVKQQIDTRKWLAGKMDPRFGVGAAVNVSGQNIQVVMSDFMRPAALEAERGDVDV